MSVLPDFSPQGGLLTNLAWFVATLGSGTFLTLVILRSYLQYKALIADYRQREKSLISL